jgi:hypothetical protein
MVRGIGGIALKSPREPKNISKNSLTPREGGESKGVFRCNTLFDEVSYSEEGIEGSALKSPRDLKNTSKNPLAPREGV